MKNVNDLTDIEVAKIEKAKADLREAALRFSQPGGSEFDLYIAAREFDRVCVVTGMDEYWKEDAQFSIGSLPS